MGCARTGCQPPNRRAPSPSLRFLCLGRPNRRQQRQNGRAAARTDGKHDERRLSAAPRPSVSQLFRAAATPPCLQLLVVSKQALAVEAAQLLQRLVLDLADALAADLELLADL